jgi:hypothetical protein
LPVYKYEYSVEKKEYTYEKWGEYSDWSTDYITSSEDVKVETRMWVKYRV